MTHVLLARNLRCGFPNGNPTARFSVFTTAISWNQWIPRMCVFGWHKNHGSHGFMLKYHKNKCQWGMLMVNVYVLNITMGLCLNMSMSLLGSQKQFFQVPILRSEIHWGMGKYAAQHDSNPSHTSMVQCIRWGRSVRDRRPSTRSWRCRLGYRLRLGVAVSQCHHGDCLIVRDPDVNTSNPASRFLGGGIYYLW